jgi:sarcosine oxidase subunit alpha
MSAPNRLDLPASHILSGHAVDRTRPVRFTLNGRPVAGFAGDSVLSAVLASGTIGYGEIAGHPFALSPETPAHVLPRRRPADQPVAMRSLAARDGLDLVTVPAPDKRPLAALARLVRGTPPTLALHELFEPAPERMTASESLSCDVCIVGGGIAGLTAALAAARAGRKVILCERDLALGGLAVLFGRIDDEEAPEAVLQRLRREIAAEPAITVLLGTEVVHVGAGSVRAIRASDEGTATLVPITAGTVLICVGAYERLPVFAGNRLPGITLSSSAFTLAHLYGVWTGRSAVVSTTVNAAYRLAMLAADGGIAIRRVYDRRAKAESRFVEFCKAYGITMSSGVAPVAARWTRAGLSLGFAVSFEGYTRAEPLITADRLVLAGGWQPDLRLWHAAGGKSVWDAERRQLAAGDGPAALVVAGSAAGHRSTAAVIASAEAAIARLTGTEAPPVVEQEIDAQYETPDGELPIAPGEPRPGAPAYLSTSSSLVALPGSRRRFSRQPRPADWLLSEESRRIDFADLVAGISLGILPPEAAGAVAAERTSGRMTLDVHPRRAGATRAPSADIPPFLAGRFGPSPARWIVSCGEDRRLDPGCLLYVNSDQTDPRYAMGVVLASGPGTGEAVALIGKINASEGEGATVRDLGRPIPIRLSRPADAPVADPVA